MASHRIALVTLPTTFLYALRPAAEHLDKFPPPLDGSWTTSQFPGCARYMRYESVNSFLLASIPEFRVRYAEEKRKRGSHPKQYIAFAALNSIVVPALDFGGDASFLASVFSAFEQMALSEDPEVVALLQVGFLQDLVRYPKRLATAWELMGLETRKLTTRTARAWNRETNLPAAARTSEKSKAQVAS